VREAEVTFLAASLAYYTFVSLVPLLVLAVVAATVVGGPELTARVSVLVGQYLVPTGQEAVEGALSSQTGRGGVTVVGLAVLVWSSLKVFRGLDVAFSKIYGGEPGTILDQVRDGIVALVGIGVGVFGVTAAGGVIVALDVPGIRLLAPVVLLLTLMAAFLPLYYVFPDLDVTVREVLPGTVFAAVGWTVLSVVFGIYAGFASQGDRALYGVLGGILLLVTWFYLGGLVLLVGGVINAVVGGRSPDRGGDRPPDRQVQHPGARGIGPTDMSADADARGDDADGEGTDRRPRAAADISELEDRLEEVRADLDAFERHVDERTVDRSGLEADLRRYIRARMRRGKARGWGPYLVLLYGTVMTLGAFVYLRGVYAIAAMLVLFLSTLGLYALFLMVGIGLNVLSVPGKAAEAVRDRRE
jgi:YihY family inner membrane protein